MCPELILIDIEASRAIFADELANRFEAWSNLPSLDLSESITAWREMKGRPLSAFDQGLAKYYKNAGFGVKLPPYLDCISSYNDFEEWKSIAIRAGMENFMSKGNPGKRTLPLQLKRKLEDPINQALKARFIGFEGLNGPTANLGGSFQLFVKMLYSGRLADIDVLMCKPGAEAVYGKHDGIHSILRGGAVDLMAASDRIERVTAEVIRHVTVLQAQFIKFIHNC